MRLKIVVGALGLLLVGWLAFAPAPRMWRDASYLYRVTAPLPTDEAEAIERELLDLAKASGFNQPVNLNQPFDPAALNVYVTNAEADALTGCRSGNALYDPRADVLLLDLAAVHAMQPGGTFASFTVTPDQGWASKTWFSFVVLHELGHRALHRYAMAWRGGERQREDEADSFAFDALGRLSDNSLTSSVLRLPTDEAVEDADRNAAVVAAAIYDFTAAQLFSNTEFSPYHADSSHAAFAERFGARVQALAAQVKSPTIRTYLLLVLDHLRRIQLAGHQIAWELRSEAPISTAELSRTDLLVTTGLGTSQRRYRIPGSRLWRSESAATNMIRLTASDIEEGSLPGQATCPRVTQEWQNGNSVWTLWRCDGSNSSNTREMLIAALRREYMLSDTEARTCTVEITPLLDDQSEAWFDCHGQWFVGALDGQLTPKTFTAFAGGNYVAKGSATALFAVPLAGQRRYYVAIDSSGDVHREKFELSVLQLRSAGMPLRLARYPLLMDLIPTGDAVYQWFQMAHPPVVACTPIADVGAVCSQFQDSIYFFDAVGGKLTPVFHPAGVKMMLDEAGRIGFYVTGGYRVFGVKLRATQRQ